VWDSHPNHVYTPGWGHRSNGINTFYHSDWLGSTRWTSDITGNTFPQALRFDAFGNRSATGDPANWHPTDLQFAGKWGYQTEWASSTDPGLGLQYLHHRHYDPAVGRFLSPDPIGYAGGLNLYAYPSDPVGRVDPLGLNDQNSGWIQPSGFALQTDPITSQDVQGDSDDALNQTAVPPTTLMPPFGRFLAPPPAPAGGYAPVRRSAPVAPALPPAYGSSASAKADLSRLAAQARGKVRSQTARPHRGPSFGTRVHSAFRGEIEAIDCSGLSPEVSYKGGDVVPPGTRGSVRVDVVQGPVDRPLRIYDLKTGRARLTPRRIQQIRRHLPQGYQNIPIEEVR
jgi:RHS repeat-associated protein